MDFTEEWMLEIAGWQVYKEARGLWKTGAVAVTESDGTGTLKGEVFGGGKPVRAMLIARSKSDVQGICPCVDSRRGILCRHAIALGVAVANGDGTEEKGADSAQESTNPVVKSELPKKRNIESYHPLCVQFAENWKSGLRRGRLAVQISIGSGQVAEADQILGDWIDDHHKGALPLMASLGGSDLETFLQAAAGHPSCRWKKKGAGEFPIEISAIPVRLPIHVKKADQNALSRISLSCTLGESVEGGYLVAESRIFPIIQPDRTLSEEWKTLAAGNVLSRPLAWFVSHLDGLQACCHLENAPGETILDHLHIVSEKPEIGMNLEGSLANLTASLICRYPVAGVEVLPGADLSDVQADAFPASDPNLAGRFFVRNLAAERAAVKRLEEAGFRPKSGRNALSGDWVLSGEREVLEFYGSTLHRLESSWDVAVGERFQALAKNLVRISPQAEFAAGSDSRRGGGDWLSFSVRYSGANGRTVAAADVQRLLRGGGSGSVRLAGGKRAVIDRAACSDLDEALIDCDPEQSSGVYKIRRNLAGYVSNTITSHNRGGVSGWGGWGQAVGDEEFSRGIGNLSTRLRGYQLEGSLWLAGRIVEAGGALLADEMGLGKTVQTLALIRYWNERRQSQMKSGGIVNPSLVVCPKSLLENWRAEAGEFASELNATIVKGTPIERSRTLESGADLFITSYGALIQDIKSHYQERQFAIVVLDEAGAIKNPKTRAARAVRSLRAEGKVALTGTPVENSVRDLWSIFEFAVPGYLGGHKLFETRYAKPLEDADKPPKEVMERLRRRVSPYILRRTKAEVVTELPQKIEKTVYCELTSKQESVYRQILEGAHAEIDMAKRRGAGAAKLAMFTALLRLRQTCCDLRVLPLAEDGPPLKAEDASSKLSAFRNELSGIIDAGGRMLCFSQFVSVLRILKADLENRSIGFSYLDGQTEHRGEVVRSFQEAAPNEKPVFLISLKAGGYGLNLTAANHVALYDPWWNPAVESQAIDRAHRIGQENVVTCSRYITRGTVEEKILQLQARKRQVIDAALEDDQPTMSGLTGEELEELFE